VAGVELAAERLGSVEPRQWARGPGNLGRAMGWTPTDSGRHLGDSLRLEPGDPVVVMSGPRVGVSVAYQRPWRFWAQGEATVSDYRRSPRIQEGRHDW